jgi:hypothetical protein
MRSAFVSFPPIFYLAMPGIVYLAWLYQIVLPATAILLSLTLPIVAFRTFNWLAKPTAASPQAVLLWATMVLMCAVTFVGLISPEEHWRAAYVDRMIVLMLVYPWCLLVIAEDARKLYENSIPTYVCLWFFLVACVALGTYHSYSQFGGLYLYFRNWAIDSTFNYQVLGDMVAVVSLLLLARIPGNWKFPFFLLCMAAIALCYSRSAVICFAAAALVIQSADRKTRVLFFMTYAIVTGIYFLTFFGTQTEASIGQSWLATLSDRMYQVLQGTDASLQGRQEITSETAQVIERAWLFGKPFYELDGTLGEGAYVHNITSYLLTYGAPVFLLLLTAIFLSFRSAFRRARHSPLYLGIAAVLVFAILSVAFFRSHVWHILWFALALVMSLNTSQKGHSIGFPVRRATKKPIV